jgi:hypothetical protein
LTLLKKKKKKKKKKEKKKKKKEKEKKGEKGRRRRLGRFISRFGVLILNCNRTRFRCCLLYLRIKTSP